MAQSREGHRGEVEWRSARGLTRRQLLKRIGVLAVAIGSAGVATHLGAETALAKPKHLKVRVYTKDGKKRPNAAIRAYKSTTLPHLRCVCEDDKCTFKPDAVGTTNKSGQAKFTGLSPSTTYEFHVDDKCELEQPGEPCGPGNACLYTPGASDTETTNKKGGSSRTLEINSAS